MIRKCFPPEINIPLNGMGSGDEVMLGNGDGGAPHCTGFLLARGVETHGKGISAVCDGGVLFGDSKITSPPHGVERYVQALVLNSARVVSIRNGTLPLSNNKISLLEYSAASKSGMGPL